MEIYNVLPKYTTIKSAIDTGRSPNTIQLSATCN